MKYLILIYLCLVTQAFGQFNVQQIDVGTTNDLTSIYFISDNTGFITGANGFLTKTTNGGDNWFPTNSGVATGIYEIQFVDSSTGWFVGDAGIIRKTTNGGNNWYVQNAGLTADEHVMTLCFINSQTGYVSGWPNWYSKTTNGGEAWIRYSFGIMASANTKIRFLDAETGYISSGGYGSKTTNGGVSWATFPNLQDFYCNDFAFGNPGSLYVAAYQQYGVREGRAVVYFTTNNGNDWQTKNLMDYGLPKALDMSSNGEIIYQVGWWGPLWYNGTKAYIAKSTNGGENWSEITWNRLGAEEDMLLNVRVTNKGVFMVGWHGLLLKEAAVVGVLNNAELVPHKFYLSQNYPNPFNPTTKISYSLPASRHVEISLYNMLGKEIYKLVNEQKNAGNYEIHFDGSKLSSGVYFYKLTAGDFTDTKKMILMK